MQAVAYHDLRGERETHARIPERRIVDQELVRAVVGVEVVRQVTQIDHQRVRCAVQGGVLDGLRKRAEALDQPLLLGSTAKPSAARPRAASCTMPRSCIWRRTLDTRAWAYWM